MNPITYYQAKRQGLIIYAYTINRPWLLGWFKRLYPSAWIISNHPERLVEDHGR